MASIVPTSSALGMCVCFDSSVIDAFRCGAGGRPWWQAPDSGLRTIRQSRTHLTSVRRPASVRSQPGPSGRTPRFPTNLLAKLDLLTIKNLNRQHKNSTLVFQKGLSQIMLRLHLVFRTCFVKCLKSCN